MSKYNVTLIPGDGIGPEVSAAARKCIEALGIDIHWDVCDAGVDVMEKYGTPLPDGVLESIKKNKVALKGPVTTPIGTGFRSVNVQIRKALNLYACVRPCKTYKGVRTRYDNIDIVIIRENTEDLYAGIEFDVNSKEAKDVINQVEKSSGKKIVCDSAISIKPISISATKAIVEYAFKYAINNGRKKVTVVHKANIMKCTDGLFSKVAKDVAKDYEGRVIFEERLIDNMCMQLVQRPNDYDVLVLPNLYGDIVSDLCAGLVGGLGIAPGANIGYDMAVFEATHGSAPKYKGLNKANPTAMILSGVLMLKYLGENKKADILENAVSRVIREGKYVTYDLKDSKDDPSAVGTSQMADAIVDVIKG